MPAGSIPSGINTNDETHVLRAAAGAFEFGPQILRQGAVISPQLSRQHFEIERRRPTAVITVDAYFISLVEAIADRVDGD